MSARDGTTVFPGTPCETFSRARTGPPGPAPLRTGTHVYGRPKEELWPREYEQFRVGRVLLPCRRPRSPNWRGTAAWVRHREPEPLAPVSLFNLPEYVAPVALIGARSINFDQCRWGAESVKPTRLLYWGADFSGLEDKRCDHAPVWREWRDRGGVWCEGLKAHTPLVGKNDCGEYRATAAAAYPSKLRSGLAWAVVRRG